MAGPRTLRSISALARALGRHPVWVGVAGAAGGMLLAGSALAGPPTPSAPPETGPTTPTSASSPPSTPPPPSSATIRARATPPPPGAAAASTPATTGVGTPAVEPEGPPQDLSDTWGYARRRPITPRYVRADNPAVFAGPNPIGFYSGVSVAGNHVPPRPPENFDSKPAMLTWAGFERAHEGSRVFFQLNAAAQYSVEQDGLQITIRLRNTKVNVRNNLRALDLRYFKTPVRTVNVRRSGKDTTARIVLKHEATPTVEIVDGKEGYKLLVVQFGDVVQQPERLDPTQRRQAPPKVTPMPASSGS